MTMQRKKYHCSTPALIIQKSLEMFNRYGERQVTTNHIAQQLELSTGNLYYHYGSKEEIIIELIAQYISKFDALMRTTLDSDATLDNFINLLEDLISLRWQYRFIINSKFGAFLYNDKLNSAYFSSEKTCLTANKNKLFCILLENGILKKTTDTAMLAHQFSLLLEAWLSMQVSNAEAVNPQTVILNGSFYMMMFILPSISDQWAEEITKLLQENRRQCKEPPINNEPLYTQSMV